jgi:hypothetical protein
MLGDVPHEETVGPPLSSFNGLRKMIDPPVPLARRFRFTVVLLEAFDVSIHISPVPNALMITPFVLAPICALVSCVGVIVKAGAADPVDCSTPAAFVTKPVAPDPVWITS